MRISARQATEIVQLARQMTGFPVDVRVFGSRLYDHARGGDLDLFIELPEPQANPALLAARLSAKISRLIGGRKVDVLLSAPNLLRLPIHEVALKEGRKL